MDRLTALDAEFLHMEDGVAHMHIAGACVFDGPPPTLAELTSVLESKLHLIPRYRQRVRQVPLELGRPVWVDDSHFNLKYHLRRTALPEPGDDAAFGELMGELMSRPLDRERPLWETTLVEGLEDGRWALICKVHHCMVDGIAGVGLLTILLDTEPRPESGAERSAEPPAQSPAPPWEPTPEPAGAAKVLDAWGGLIEDAGATAAATVKAVLHPTAGLRTVIDTVQGFARFAGSLTANPVLSIEGPIGPQRSWAHGSASLADVRSIRDAFGGTVNDVVLTAVTAGYRALLQSRGDDPDNAVIRSMVPVSTRRDDGAGVPDNRVTTLLYDLPVQVADPLERLHLVHTQMAGLKTSHMAEAGEVVTSLGNLAPPMLVGGFTRLAMKAVNRLPQRSINTVTTNVPGPQFPLYCLGHRMLEYRPFVGISHGVRVSTAILSYDGRLFFGVTGDQASVPDVAVLAEATVAEIDELRRRATRTSTKRKRSAS